MLAAPRQRHFEVRACLGRGGFGEVYLARLSRGDFAVDVALKLLRPDIDPSGQGAARLRDEARLLGQLRHRSIPRVLDCVVLEGRLALVVELLDGADLDDCLRLQPPLPPRAAIQAVAEVARALHAAWNTRGDDGRPIGLVHRDLKPANLRLLPDGGVRVLDWGIAWTAEAERAARTQTGAMVGSPSYMAPERFVAVTPGPAGDVYSLGCVLVEVLTGRRLWSGVPFAVLAALAPDEDRFTAALTARLDLGPEAPPALRRLVERCLGWDPEARPDALHLADALDALADTLPGQPLDRWARSVAWPAPARLDGPLCGRVLVEGDVADAPLPAAGPRPPRVTVPDARGLGRRTEADLPTPETLDTGWDDGGGVPTDVAAALPPRRADVHDTATDVAAPRPVEETATFADDLPPAGPVVPPGVASVATRPGDVERSTAVDAAAAPIDVVTVTGLIPVPPSPPGRPWRPALAALALIGLGALGARLLPPRTTAPVEAAPAIQATTAVGPATDAPAPLTPPPTAAPPPAAAAAAPAPEVAPRAAASRPVAAVAPTARTAGAPPALQAPPEPAPVSPPAAPSPTARVDVDPATAAMRPRLERDGRTFSLPADLPAGRYKILAEFVPDNPQVFGSATLTDGQTVTLRCANKLCAVK